tara:strand:+ start:8261 stop:8608 length:348 start_codon:yes stop_codon:yes gene_type:complete
MYKIEEILVKNEINGKELEYLLSERKTGAIDFLLVDVREEYEYQEKRIVGVDYLVPISDFFNKIQDIEGCKSQHIIVKCKLGGRSAQAQMQMKALGFQKVINLAGGITNYCGEIV